MAGVRRSAVATVVGAVLLLGVTGSPAGAAQSPDRRAADDVEQALRERLDAAAIPDAAFVVVHRDGRSDARGVGGTGGDDKVTSRTHS